MEIFTKNSAKCTISRATIAIFLFPDDHDLPTLSLRKDILGKLDFYQVNRWQQYFWA
jgi:hypothetical protein